MSDKYVTGVDAVVKSLRVRFDSNAKRAVTVATRAMLEDVYQESQALVPVDTEALKKSGRIEERRQENGLLEGTVEYGGQAAPHALYVHEDLDAQHAAPTQAKYLEEAVRRAKTRRKEILRRAFSSVMGYTKNPT